MGVPGAGVIPLADVNVLLALLWPKHEGHKAAHVWFAQTGDTGWATNPLTQLGVLRLLTNPALTRSALSVGAALSLVTQACQHPRHVFWPLESGLLRGLGARATRMQGYRQWTDAALLAQAEERGGVVVTFDAGMRELAGDRASELVLVLKAK